MKKTLIIFSLFFISLFSSLFSNVDCKNRCSAIVYKTSTIENKLKNKEFSCAIKDIENLQTLWGNYEKILRIYLKRKNLEDIEKEILNLKNSVEYSDEKTAQNSIKQIIKLCNDCVKETTPTITTIL